MSDPAPLGGFPRIIRRVNVLVHSKQRYLQWLFLSATILVSALEVLFLLHLHQKNLVAYSDFARGVVVGTPPWRAYQNRLLGSWLAWGATEVFGHGYKTWFLILTGIFWAGANVATYWAAYKLTGNRFLAAGATATSVLMTLMLEGPQGEYLYLWDPLDVLLLTAFTYGVFAKKSLGFFLLVFCIELLNREAAIFIALWLAIDSFRMSRSGGSRRLSLANPRQLVVGLSLVAGGTAWTKFIRDALFKHSMMVGIGQDTRHVGLGNYSGLVDNLHTLAHSCTLFRPPLAHRPRFFHDLSSTRRISLLAPQRLQRDFR